MNFKQKLGYMFIGCVFTLAGYILANFSGKSIAQQQNDIVADSLDVGSITCRHFAVVGEDGKRIATIDRDKNGNGVLLIYNKDREDIALIGTDADGNGHLHIGAKYGIESVGLPTAAISTDSERGGRLTIRDKKGNRAVVVATDSDGSSWQAFYNKAGHPTVIILSGGDSGILKIYNKGGQRVALLGIDLTDRGRQEDQKSLPERAPDPTKIGATE